MATQTAYRDWADEPDDILATVIDELQTQAREAKRRGVKR